MAAFEAVAQGAKALKIGWRIEGDSVLVRDRAQCSNNEEDVDVPEALIPEDSIL